ncbi:MAG: efflux RND transporter permease subunit [Bacteroidales bacterium]|nr:efflux RND transporter permease subunit [Bacteroidales bacterium]
MKKSFENYIRRPFYSLAIIFILIVAGTWSLFNMPVDYFPGINYPLVNVITQYPGASPKDMEILFTDPIENALEGIRGIKRTSSVTTMGHSEVTVEFSDNYSVKDARQLTTAALSTLSGQLPSGAVPVIDNLGSRMQDVIGFTFDNPEIPPYVLRDIVQYRIKPALLSLGNISRIDVIGGNRPAFIVEPNPEKLRLLHLSLMGIENVLKSNNIIVSGRYLQHHYYDIPIQGNGQYQKLSDLDYLRVATLKNGTPVFLKDIATIRLGGLPEHYSVRSNQYPAVALLVQKAEGVGSIVAASAVQKKLQSLQKLLPPGTEVHKFYDQSEVLSRSMDGVRKEVYIGAVLAMLVLFLFLQRIAPTLIVSITIPLALFFAAIIMYAMNYSLNMITLAALTLSLGMVVDDSIIVLEIIEKFLEKGKSLMESIQSGVKEIFAADLNGTLTTIIVFLPLLFFKGYIKDMITPFGLTITLTLAGSFLISITVIPALVYWKGNLKGDKPVEAAFLDKFKNFNDRLLRFSMQHKKSVITGLIVLFTAGAVSVPLLNEANMLPPVDEGALLFEYVMKPGVSLKESVKVGEQLADIIRENPNVNNIYLRIGSPENSFYMENVNRGELFIKLVSKNHRTESVSQLMAGFKKQFATFDGVVILYHQPTEENIDESFSGLPAFFGVSVTGPNLDTLANIASTIEKVAHQSGYFSDIINNSQYLVPQLDITPNRPELARYGLNASNLFQQLALAFRGEVVASFVKEQVLYSVFLRLPEKDRKNIETLKELPVQTDNGNYIPLEKLANIRIVNSIPSISHLDGERELTVIASPLGNLFSAVKKLKTALGQKVLPEGYNIQIRGQYQTMIETVKSFTFVILIAVFLIYLILYLQFNSFWQPFVILLKIPLDFIGVFIALLITRQQLNISVALGLLTLIGVSVNNAIILIDKVNRLQKEEHYSLDDALQEAVHARTRPILMTGLTTIIAVLPAALGFGSAIHQPFAITIVGGMLTGIFFSLNIIPAFYQGFARRFERK